VTIDDVRLGWSNLGGSASTSDGRSFNSGITQGWQVTHSADATVEEVMAAVGLPKVGDRYGSTYLVVKSQNAQRVSPIFSMVTISYEGEIGVSGEGQPDPNQTPINNPPVIDWSDEGSNELVDVDADGNPIQTVNGEKINGVTIEVSDPVLVVTKNFSNYSPHLIHAYRRAVNSDTFAGFPPGTARMVGASAKLMNTANNLYWQVTGRFKFRFPYNTTPDKAWYARVLHEGFLAINNDTDELEHAKVNDEKVVTPVALTITGYQIPSSALPDAAVWLEFKLYDSLPFNALGFL
jgi:hypothetical protein